MSSDNPLATARRKHRIRNEGRGQISVKGTTHAKLKVVAEGLNKSMGQIVEEQVNEYLDRVEAAPEPEAPPVLEPAPRPFLCASCGNDRHGVPYRMPWGRKDALVDVCDGCVNDHTRSGKYHFGGSGKSRGAGFVQTGKSTNR